jgi:hypothetical protein
MSPTEDIRTLEVRTRHEGLFRIEIPATWKVTFSKVNPQAGGYEAMALRVYEGEEKQRACFSDVVSFRDISIPLTRRVKKSKEQVNTERDGRKSSLKRKTEVDYEWTAEPTDDDHGPF